MLNLMDGTARILYDGTANIKEIYLGKDVDFFAAKIIGEFHNKLTKDYVVEILFADNDSTSTVCKPGEYSLLEVVNLCNQVEPYKKVPVHRLTLLKDTEGVCSYSIGCIPKPWLKFRINEVASDGSLTEITTPILGMYLILMHK